MQNKTQDEKGDSQPRIGGNTREHVAPNHEPESVYLKYWSSLKFGARIHTKESSNLRSGSGSVWDFLKENSMLILAEKTNINYFWQFCNFGATAHVPLPPTEYFQEKNIENKIKFKSITFFIRVLCSRVSINYKLKINI